MWFLPFARVSLDSHRSPDELLARLQAITGQPPTTGEISFIRHRETSTFVGEVSKERLAFRCAQRGRNSFAPFVIGQIVHGPSGARIEAVMRPHMLALSFVVAWLVCLTPLALLGIPELIEKGTASELAAWVPVALWGAMYPMCMIGFIPEALKMQRLLREITVDGFKRSP